MSPFYDLREDIQPGDIGRIDTVNEQNHRLNTAVVMPDPTDAAVNVANFNNAITKASANGFGGTILFPPGKWTFNSTLRVRNLIGLRVIGCGYSTQLEFNVSAGADWVTIEHSQHCHWSDMYLYGTGSGIARSAFALLRTNSEGSVYAPSQNHLHDLSVDGKDKAESAVLIGGVDANNDFHTFERCTMQGYTVRGFDLRGVMQSYANEMRNVRLYAGTGAQYGVDMGQAGVGATFNWSGGIMVGHTVADFRLSRSYQSVVIDGGFHSEGSARFLVVAGIYKQIAVRDARWAGNLMHADNKAITWTGIGQLSMENCSIGDGQAVTPALTFDIPTGNMNRVSFRRNRVYSSAAAVFPNGVPGDLYGNDQITNEVENTTIVLEA